jgi:hypothetical protein
MEAWLRCTITPGQFSSEYVASGADASGDEFGLFVPAEFVEVSRPPTRETSVEGRMRVEVWDRKGDLVLVHLPREMLDGRHYLTVRADQVETRGKAG